MADTFVLACHFKDKSEPPIYWNGTLFRPGIRGWGPLDSAVRFARRVDAEAVRNGTFGTLSGHDLRVESLP